MTETIVSIMVCGIIDLFCGTGGFSHGVRDGIGDNAEVLLGIDILQPAISTFVENNPETEVICGNIVEYPPEVVSNTKGISKSDVDIIIGGPPCQGFSSIRPNRSTNDNDLRNFLYLDFLNYVEYYQPLLFIMENVVGLATHNKGKTLDTILKRIYKIGYAVDWRLLNAANFGVPQRRERLIMIGLRDEREIEFPKPTHKSKGQTIGYFDKTKVITDTQTIDDICPRKKAITAWEAISDLPPLKAGEECKKYSPPTQNEYQYRVSVNSKELTLHYATNHSERMLNIIKHSGYSINDLPKGMVKSGFSTSYSRIEPNLPSVTLTGNFPFPGSNKCIHPFQDRAITPREAARIQSFPDNYKLIGNRTQIAKQIGNAVPPLLGNMMGEFVKKYL